MPLACADMSPYGKGSPRNFIRSETRAKAKWRYIEPLFRFGLLSGVILPENRYPPSDRCPRAGFFGIVL